MNEPVILTREQLYQLVWSTPMRTLAKQFGISDRGLAKKCDAHNIPRPPQGYWLRLKHSKKTKKQPLPECDVPYLEKVYFYPKPEACHEDDLVETTLSDDDLEKVVQFRLPERVNRYHPLIKARRDDAKRKILDKYGRIVFGRELSGLELKVTPNTFGRACLFIEGLVRVTNLLGWRFEENSVSAYAQKCGFVFNDEVIVVEIKESVKQIAYVKDKRERDSSYYWGPKYDYLPTGVLEFTLTGLPAAGFRTKWKDRDGVKFESCLVEIVENMSRGIELRRIKAVEAEKKRILREREEAERRGKQRLRLIEERRRDHLVSLAQDFEQVNVIRDFLSAVVNKGAHGDDVVEWLEWASRVVDEIDPINSLSDIVVKHESLGVSEENY